MTDPHHMRRAEHSVADHEKRNLQQKPRSPPMEAHVAPQMRTERLAACDRDKRLYLTEGRNLSGLVPQGPAGPLLKHSG